MLLFTGEGGVGKSTLAAATACASAAAGHRTLVLSTAAAHSLADALAVTATGEPTQVAPDLWVQHVDAQERFERSWAEIRATCSASGRRARGEHRVVSSPPDAPLERVTPPRGGRARARGGAPGPVRRADGGIIDEE